MWCSTVKHMPTTRCWDLDQWQVGSLQFRWQSVSQETSVCILMGRGSPTYLCVPTERCADLVQLSRLHLERQLIQSWRRLAGDCILANSSTTNSIICSMLVSVSSLTLLCPPLPILVFHRSPFTSVSGIFRVAGSLKYALVYFLHKLLVLFIILSVHWGLFFPPAITFPLQKTKFLAVKEKCSIFWFFVSSWVCRF